MAKEYIEREALMKRIKAHIKRITPIEESRDMFFHDSGINAEATGAWLEVKNAPAADVVARCTLDQIRWERDMAMKQLNDHGIPFGGIAPDVVEVVRCKDCKHKHNMIGNFYLYCVVHNTKMYTDDFCSYGERRNDA